MCSSKPLRARTHSIRNRLARSRNLSKVHIMVSIVICHLLHVRHAYGRSSFAPSCVFCMRISVRVWRLMHDNVHCTGKKRYRKFNYNWADFCCAQQNLCANLCESYPMRTWLGVYQLKKSYICWRFSHVWIIFLVLLQANRSSLGRYTLMVTLQSDVQSMDDSSSSSSFYTWLNDKIDI